MICDDESDAANVAERIRKSLKQGIFRVSWYQVHSPSGKAWILIAKVTEVTRRMVSEFKIFH
jgi:hypothetical protein